MKVSLFIDWSRQEIMSQAEGEELLASQKHDEGDYADYRGSYLNDIIEEWLKNHPTVHYSEFYAKLFDLTEAERAEIEAECRKGYEEQVESDFYEDWDEVRVEV